MNFELLKRVELVDHAEWRGGFEDLIESNSTQELPMLLDTRLWLHGKRGEQIWTQLRDPVKHQSHLLAGDCKLKILKKFNGVHVKRNSINEEGGTNNSIGDSSDAKNAIEEEDTRPCCWLKCVIIQSLSMP